MSEPLPQEISLEVAARGFSAIGSEPRLAVLLTLVRAGPAGLNVGEIQSRLDIPGSTLAHHLKFLAAADLIEQRREGRLVINHAAFDHISALADFLVNQCCLDENLNTNRPGETGTPAMVKEPAE